jgi:alkylhydroperoxidase/carboxymuconolactone decarboxylase family protein YurZ
MKESIRSHLRQALAWQPHDGVSPRQQALACAVAALGVGVPGAVGAVAGQLSAGLAVAIGSLPVAGIGFAPTWREQWRQSMLAMIGCLLAVGCVRLIAGWGPMMALAVPVIAALVALFGGVSRPAAVFAMRFTLAFVMALNVFEGAAAGAAGPLLLALGSVWTTLLWLGAGALAWRWKNAPPAPPARVIPWRRRLTWWRGTLRTAAGWSYPSRLFACLMLSVAADMAFPHRHMLWIAFTVVLLLPREAEVMPLRVTQRVAGMLLGVALSSALLLLALTPGALIVVLSLLALAQPLLRDRSYAGYSALITMLVLLLIDASGMGGDDLLKERLLATLVAAGLVVAASVLFRRLTAAGAS